MNKVDIKFENCYGIKKLEYSFDFSKHSNYLIYASNGMMKTSFTKIFKALSTSKKPVDEIFARKTFCEVKVDNVDIDKEQIFVINSYEDEYISPNSAKLMVHKELRNQYDKVVTGLNTAKDAFFDSLKVILQDTNDPLIYLSDFLECTTINVIEKLAKQVDEGLLKEDAFSIDFSKIKYYDIFNNDVEKFVSDPKNLLQIEEYEKRYNELLSKSPIFKRGVFSHNNAETITDNLTSNGFFDAEHTVFLHGIDKEIKTAEDLNSTITVEKEKIFSDEKLKKKFDKINSALGKRSLIKFRAAIENNQEIIPQLTNYNIFKRKVWVKILQLAQNELNVVLMEYNKC